MVAFISFSLAFHLPTPLPSRTTPMTRPTRLGGDASERRRLRRGLEHDHPRHRAHWGVEVSGPVAALSVESHLAHDNRDTVPSSARRAKHVLRTARATRRHPRRLW